MKNWLVLLGIIVFALTVWLHASYNRYTIASFYGPNVGGAYKLDKLTGKVRLVALNEEMSVKSK